MYFILLKKKNGGRPGRRIVTPFLDFWSTSGALYASDEGPKRVLTSVGPSSDAYKGTTSKSEPKVEELGYIGPASAGIATMTM